MVISRSLLYIGLLPGCLLLSAAGCSKELPPAPPEVVLQAHDATPPTIDFGTPMANSPENASKPAVPN